MVTKKFCFGDGRNGVYNVRFSDDSQYLAACHENNELEIFNLKSGKPVYNLIGKDPKIPFSCVRWRPTYEFVKSRYVLVTLNSDGDIQHWHMPTGKLLRSVSIKKKGHDPSLNNMDLVKDTNHLAVVGADSSVPPLPFSLFL
jgi:COMPASS component SWD3